jgi:hypothetical protein
VKWTCRHTTGKSTFPARWRNWRNMWRIRLTIIN